MHYIKHCKHAKQILEQCLELQSIALGENHEETIMTRDYIHEVGQMISDNTINAGVSVGAVPFSSTTRIQSVEEVVPQSKQKNSLEQINRVENRIDAKNEQSNNLEGQEQSQLANEDQKKFRAKQHNTGKEPNNTDQGF